MPEPTEPTQPTVVPQVATEWSCTECGQRGFATSIVNAAEIHAQSRPGCLAKDGTVKLLDKHGEPGRLGTVSIQFHPDQDRDKILRALQGRTGAAVSAAVLALNRHPAQPLRPPLMSPHHVTKLQTRIQWASYEIRRLQALSQSEHETKTLGYVAGILNEEDSAGAGAGTTGLEQAAASGLLSQIEILRRGITEALHLLSTNRSPGGLERRVAAILAEVQSV